MGSLNFFRYLVVVNGAVPLTVLLWDAYRGQLGANSVNYALHVTGIMSLVFLILSLLMSPMRWLTGWGGWIAFRRSLGLFGFFYSILHLGIYVGFDRGLNLASTLQEIWMRRFLQVGTAALLLMIPLAVTSTNTMIRKLGPKNWKLLHRIAYLVAILGVVHYYLLVKSDIRQPVAFAAVVTGLLGARAVRHYYELRQAANRSPQTASASKTGQGLKNRKFWKGELKVIALFQETPDVRTFRLAAIDGGVLPFDYLPGQYMNVQWNIDGKTVNRSYTIASSPTRRDTCELSVKWEPKGLVSRYMHDTLRVGDTFKVSAPAGKFVFEGSDSNEVLLIAGGVGITPLMSIVRFLTDRSWTGDIYFLVVAKSEQDLIFRDELSLLQKRFPNLHVCTTLTRATPGNDWQGEHGRASEAMLRKFVPDCVNIPCYLCGPDEMMEATRSLLLRIGMAASSIHTEAFLSPGVGKESAEISELETFNAPSSDNFDSNIHKGEPKQVQFKRSKNDCTIADDISILEAAEQLTVDLPFECRSGICGQCKVRLLSGSVKMDFSDALSPFEREQGYILACQSHPTSDVVIDA